MRVLDDYFNHLLALDIELEHAETAKHALAVDDESAELLTNAVGDELATEHLAHLSGEAHALTGAITELVEALNGDLQTLMALPQSPPDVSRGRPSGTHGPGCTDEPAISGRPATLLNRPGVSGRLDPPGRMESCRVRRSTGSSRVGGLFGQSTWQRYRSTFRSLMGGPQDRHHTRPSSLDRDDHA
ncbi:hypothetical protein [Rhodococcus marinonascens]|uniref:hypothetical protein n=1 Tax=Rhodococcus marinonascens TaxID=38311 RepID=UPI000934B519|nr:hypothetical protein [Rhodococcus marinonascens]